MSDVDGKMWTPTALQSFVAEMLGFHSDAPVVYVSLIIRRDHSTSWATAELTERDLSLNAHDFTERYALPATAQALNSLKRAPLKATRCSGFMADFSTPSAALRRLMREHRQHLRRQRGLPPQGVCGACRQQIPAYELYVNCPDCQILLCVRCVDAHGHPDPARAH